MKIAFAVRNDELWRGLIRSVREQHGDDHTIVVADDTGDPQLHDADALICFRMREEDLGAMTKIRYIAIPMAGLNSLPVPALRDRDVIVVNAHANGRWVAERALALILAFYGRIIPYHRDLENEVWHGFAAGEPAHDAWNSIVGSTVAILGTGSIGQWIARLLVPFDVHVRGLRRRGGFDGLPAGLFDVIETNAVAAVHGADTVVVTLPLTDGTRGLIGADELSAMKHALLVNIGRGAIVDERALYDALTSGTLAGAAIDAWYHYPDPADGRGAPAHVPIHTLPNVVLSPHLGGYTPQATEASAREVVRDLVMWVRTGTTDAAVDLALGY
jgi:phosphoglycerate dehydrogenase-like enzyme